MPLHLTICREIVQKYVPRFIFFLFNITFISFIQSVLLFAFSCVPAYAILLSSKFDQSITTGDIFYFAIQAALVVVEFVSDGQQWSKSPICLLVDSY